MSITETCQVRIPDGGRSVLTHTCGRKLSGSDDYPELCGLHAAANRRAKAKAERDRIKKSTAQNAVAEADAKVVSLNNRLEIVAVAQIRFDSKLIAHPTGNAIVPIDQLERLATQIDELRQENLRRRLGAN